MRSLVSFVLLLVACVLLPVTVAATWLRSDVVPTQAYVDTVAPLSSDPDVRAGVAGLLSRETMQAVDRRGLPVGRAQVETLVDGAAAAAVGSDAFTTVWRSANKVAHDEVVAVLANDPAAADVRSDGTVDVRLGGLGAALRRELVAAKVPLAGSLPTVRASVPIGTVPQLHRARTAYRLLDAWGPALPFVTGVLLVLGIALARRRSRAVVLTGIGAALGMGVLGALLYAGRSVYLDALSRTLSRDAAGAFFDTVTEGLRRDIVLVGVAAIAAFAVATIAAAVAPRR